MASVLDIAGGGSFLTLFITRDANLSIGKCRVLNRRPLPAHRILRACFPALPPTPPTRWRRSTNTSCVPLVFKVPQLFPVIPSHLFPFHQRHGRLGFRFWYCLPHRECTTILVG
jgi:hypothetical protein